ncbi:DUF4998 domain-containing protein [Compostibacter hankyongensis]|uniref:DUF4998 domain-containing protein n=1 Tax=Compostibacter hankyongensis TaxID=1007089 RepID=A0ABP8G3Q6_9BACT
MAYHYIRCFVLPTFLCCLLWSCSKMDESYRPLRDKGEINYPGKADSIIVYPGQNRVRLSWILRADPNVVSCRIFWNNGRDSVDLPVERTHAQDTLSIVIKDLEEGNYVFEVYTYDDKDNVSVKTSADGRVYGASYTDGLTDRRLLSALKVNGKTKLLWAASPETSLGTEVRYTDQAGATHTRFIPPSDSISRWEGYPGGDTLQYRTLYMPEVLSIDTFFTAYNTITVQQAVPEKLDPATFREFTLPTDAQPLSGTKVSNLWNGVLAGKVNNVIQWYRTVDGSGIPHWFSFDMGMTASITGMLTWQRGTLDEPTLLYANGNPRKWEIWGSNDPAPDGSWTGWTKLADGESVKPSGLPQGQTTPEDIEHARDGEATVFPENTPAVRYIRIKILETWARTDYMFMSEIELQGIAE